MKTILVKALAARESGAMTILREYARAAREDPQNRYVFLTGVSLPEAENCLRVESAQKGLLRRVLFDLFGIRRCLRAIRPDEILSLDNLTVPCTRIPQTLYLQCVIPFVPDPWRFEENKRLWMYRYPMKPLIIHSVRKAKQVIVQTEWMKALCREACHVPGEKILVRPPYAHLREQKLWQGSCRFFYPATPYPYKDHAVLFRALKRLGEQAMELRLTLSAEQLSSFGEAYEAVRGHVTPLGTLRGEAMAAEYQSSMLVFPSRLESYGLPLKEARLVGAPILAAETPFAKEVLRGYDRAFFFPPGDDEALAKLMLALQTEKELAHADGHFKTPSRS